MNEVRHGTFGKVDAFSHIRDFPASLGSFHGVHRTTAMLCQATMDIVRKGAHIFAGPLATCLRQGHGQALCAPMYFNQSSDLLHH